MTQHAVLTKWLATLGAAVASQQFVKLSLSKPTAAAGDMKSIDVRPILVKRELKLSFTYHHKTRDIVKNYVPDESAELIAALLEAQFAAGRLCTTEADLALVKTAQGYEVKRSAPSQKSTPELSHDRAKQRLIESGNKPYLHALGITDAQGKVYKTTQDKFRQINKYIEVLDGLVKQLAARESLRIADMGAGKGYLTFALYDHLVNNLKLKADIVGVEFRPELVAICNETARVAGFSGLNFVRGSIADYDCAGADVVIALHACDTATDDAIHKAIRADASLIVVAPCCHKQIRREMKPPSGGYPLDFLMKYGTYVERIAEMVTDGMRAQLMELNGYRTNLFEFISDAHTPKNVMIVATKAAMPKQKKSEELEASLARTKAEFGITYHQLERLLA